MGNRWIRINNTGYVSFMQNDGACTFVRKLFIIALRSDGFVYEASILEEEDENGEFPVDLESTYRKGLKDFIDKELLSAPRPEGYSYISPLDAHKGEDGWVEQENAQ